jgi:AcrR family transcriptional regulator
MTFAPRIPPPAPSGQHRDPERTRERILEAAVEEFAAEGFTGARVDSIAEKAGVNKRMLYHYFGNKQDLFVAIIHDRLERKGVAIGQSPCEVGAAFTHFHADVRADMPWVRLMQWEALQLPLDPVIGAEAREAHIAHGLAQVERAQAQGLWPGLDTRQVLLSLMGMVMVPYLLPQVAKLVTGLEPCSDAFLAARNEFFSQILPSNPEAAASPPPSDSSAEDTSKGQTGNDPQRRP